MKYNDQSFKWINFHTDFEKPIYKENLIRGSWITWGEDNLYPSYLLALMEKSSKHNAIIKSKANMIAGNGWDKSNLTPGQSMFIFNPNSKDNLNEVLSKATYDFELYGAFALNITWSNDRKSIGSIAYMDVSKLRIATPDPGKCEPESYYYCFDWYQRRRYPPVLYPGFSTINRSKANQILYVKDFRPGSEWYGMPEYISASNWIQLEYEISQFHLNSIVDGFAPDLVINFSEGIPSDEEMDSTIRRLRKEYSGSKGRKVMFTFSDGKDNAATITPISLNESDNRFIELNKSVTEGIMVGHRVVNPSLFGIKTEGELGGKNNILESMSVFKAQYIDSKTEMIENQFKKLTDVNGLPKLTIAPFKIKLDIQPNVADVLSILAAPISDSQKLNILIEVGYEKSVAEGFIKNNTI